MEIGKYLNTPLIKLIGIIFIVGGLFFTIDIFLIVFGGTPSFTLPFVMPFIIGLFSSFFVTFIFLEDYFKLSADLKFKRSFGRLLGEIKYNHDMASTFCLNNYIQQAQEKWLNREEYWIPEKYPSFTPWSNFFYQYFPANVYYYFINQEYIIDNRLSRGLLSAIGRFYSTCTIFSNDTQLIENDINQYLNLKTVEQIREGCQNIKIKAEYSLPKIEEEYNRIMNDEIVKNFIASYSNLIIS